MLIQEVLLRIPRIELLKHLGASVSSCPDVVPATHGTVI